MLCAVSKFVRHRQIRWTLVAVGLAAQFVMGLFLFKWTAGYDMFDFLMAEIIKFVLYSMEGASVVFGDPGFLLHMTFTIVSVSTDGARKALSSS